MHNNMKAEHVKSRLTHLSPEVDVTVEAAQEGRGRVDLLPVSVEKSVHHEDSAAVGTRFRRRGIGFTVVEKIRESERLILRFLLPHCFNSCKLESKKKDVCCMKIKKVLKVSKRYY